MNEYWKRNLNLTVNFHINYPRHVCFKVCMSFNQIENSRYFTGLHRMIMNIYWNFKQTLQPTQFRELNLIFTSLKRFPVILTCSHLRLTSSRKRLKQHWRSSLIYFSCRTRCAQNIYPVWFSSCSKLIKTNHKEKSKENGEVWHRCGFTFSTLCSTRETTWCCQWCVYQGHLGLIGSIGSSI